MLHCNAHDCIFSVMWECIYNAYWFGVCVCVCVWKSFLQRGCQNWQIFMLGERHMNVKFIMEHPIAFCFHGMYEVQSTQQFALEFYVMSGYLSCHVTPCHVMLGISKHNTFQGYFATWSRTCSTCSELLETQITDFMSITKYFSNSTVSVSRNTVMFINICK